MFARLLRQKLSKPKRQQLPPLSDRDLADMGIKRYQLEGL
jgi:uncharacterized protein YjiS (DUF1127 family)